MSSNLPLVSAPERRAATSESAEVASGERVPIPLEGFITGLIGAAAVALWFFAIDCFRSRPFFTPSLLGTAFFKGRAALGSDPTQLAVSFQMVFLYTWLHVIIFVVIGGLASRLFRLAAKNPEYGFGIILGLVIFLGGFQAACMVFAEDVLRALAWPLVFGGNLLAAAVMGGYLWRRYPRFTFLM